VVPRGTCWVEPSGSVICIVSMAILDAISVPREILKLTDGFKQGQGKAQLLVKKIMILSIFLRGAKDGFDKRLQEAA
jgi:hypothetical protein